MKRLLLPAALVALALSGALPVSSVGGHLTSATRETPTGIVEVAASSSPDPCAASGASRATCSLSRTAQKLAGQLARPSASPSPRPAPSSSAPAPSPTPSPTTQPGSGSGSSSGSSGGTRSSDCLPDPSACGYPDAGTTGVPQGTDLLAVGPGNPVDCSKGCGSHGTGWHWTGSELRVDQADAVVSAVAVSGTVYIDQAPDAVIKNSRVTCASSDCLAVQVRQGSDDVLLTDTEVTDKVGGASAGIFNAGGKNLTLRRLDIHGFGGGVQTSTYGWKLEDSYIHDVSVAGDSHGNGVQTSGSGGASIVHNTIDNENTYTDAVMLTNDFGSPQRDDKVTDNLLAGGGYTVYGGDTGSGGGCSGRCSGIEITDNRVVPGHYGWITSVAPGAVVTGNRDDTSNQALSD